MLYIKFNIVINSLKSFYCGYLNFFIAYMIRNWRQKIIKTCVGAWILGYINYIGLCNFGTSCTRQRRTKVRFWLEERKLFSHDRSPISCTLINIILTPAAVAGFRHRKCSAGRKYFRWSRKSFNKDRTIRRKQYQLLSENCFQNFKSARREVSGRKSRRNLFRADRWRWPWTGTRKGHSIKIFSRHG